MRIGWLFGIEPHAAEEVLACRGLAAEEVAVVPGEASVEAVEGEEDLRGASSAVEEGAEVGGADMFAPSPGKSSWTMTAASHGNRRANQDIIYAVSMETWWYDVVTNNVQTVLMFSVLLLLAVFRK